MHFHFILHFLTISFCFGAAVASVCHPNRVSSPPPFLGFFNLWIMGIVCVWVFEFLCFSEFAFADVGNLEHCIKYLNQTLVTFGFPASLDLFANDPVSFAFVL